MSKASDMAYDSIKAWIMSGRIKPGQQLKEEELALQCGVSRTPVRDALVRLENDLLVEKRDNQRSFVIDPSRDDLDELFALRAMLEGHAAARAAERATPALIAKLRDCLRSVENAPTIEQFLTHNSAFHKIVLDAAGSRRLVGMMEKLISQPVIQRTAQAFTSEQIHRSISEHAELLEAIESRDSDWARAVMTGHIRRAFHIYGNALDEDAEARAVASAANEA